MTKNLPYHKVPR